MKIAIITGASSGIGREFALAIDKKYSLDCIWLISRRAEKLKETAALMQTKTEIIPVDLAQDNSYENIQNKLENEKPHIQLLVNAAGFGKFGGTVTISDEDAENMINVNIRALTMITKHCIPYMATGGHIINMASASAFVSLPHFGIYSATKSYVLQFSLALANELRNSCVGVTAVCPYWVASEFIPTAQDTPDGDDINNFMFITYPFTVADKALCDSEKGKMLSLIGMVPKIVKCLSKIMPIHCQHLIWNCMRKITVQDSPQYPVQSLWQAQPDRSDL